MRVDLPLGDCGLVVHRMIHAAVLFGGGEHRLALSRIVYALDGSGERPRFFAQRDDHQRTIPVVDGDEVPLLPVDRDVASRGSAGVDAANLREAPVRADFVREYLAVLLDVLGARVDDVEPVALQLPT